MTSKRKYVTRREALAGGLAGAAALAGLTCSRSPASKAHGRKEIMSGLRMPVAYVPHGGGPWPFVDIGFPKSEADALAAYLRGLRELPKTTPKALLVVSAHWEERVPTLMTAERPPIFYDYYGFPPESYTIPWPAPGAPELATRVQTLLGQSGFDTASDPERGFDHGTFIPFKLTYPEADVPTVQVSLKKNLDPAEHLAMGRALAPLRDEGVFILGSGMSYHNMGAFRLSMNGDAAGAERARGESEAFDGWLRDTVVQPAVERDDRLSRWASAPGARACHPREEHLLPLMVIAGAAMEDRGTVAYNEPLMGFKCTAVHFG